MQSHVLCVMYVNWYNLGSVCYLQRLKYIVDAEVRIDAAFHVTILITCVKYIYFLRCNSITAVWLDRQLLPCMPTIT